MCGSIAVAGVVTVIAAFVPKGNKNARSSFLIHFFPNGIRLSTKPPTKVIAIRQEIKAMHQLLSQIPLRLCYVNFLRFFFPQVYHKQVWLYVHDSSSICHLIRSFSGQPSYCQRLYAPPVLLYCTSVVSLAGWSHHLWFIP